MADPSQALRTSLAGRYDVERELGEGGMATVYLADDVRHGRKVAIKVLRSEIAATLGTERFLAEIKLTAKLQHPHILGLIDSGVVGDVDTGFQPFYVMPLITGETLRGRLARSVPLPTADALGLLIEIADALACAHAHDIVHRDIKPENILLSQGHAFVADFGVAKALHHSIDGGNITLTGVSVGTPAYMSPEQAVADPTIDHRADLYALGVVAYEMIAGKTPFVGPTAAAMVKASLTQDAVPLISTVPACPPRLSSLVAAMLEKNPDDRPQTALEVRDTLRSILAFASAETGSLPKRASSKGVVIAVGLGLVVVLAAVMLWHPWQRSDTATVSPAISRVPRSIAVLPFRNINNDSATDYFADGMAEELISALGRLQRLRVTSRTSTFALKGRSGSLADVLKQLDVDAVVESSVRHDADSVLINARLIDVQRDSTLWSGEYKGGMRNVLYVQDSVARSIAGALSAVLGADASTTLARPRVSDPRAYDAYVRGRVFLGQRNPATMGSAIKHFESSIRLDSSFAPAYAGLADAYSLLAPFGGRPPREVFPLARSAAERALALDSTLAEAHTSLGIVSMFYDWNWPDAGKHLERAIALNPSFAEGHLFYAWYLGFRGRMTDALAEMAKAQILDQLSPVIATRHANILQSLGRHEEAIPILRHALVLDSTFFNARVALAYSLLETGQRDEARRVVPREIRVSTGEAGYPAWILAQLGDTSAARDQLRQFQAAAQRGYVSADAIAGAYAAVGDSSHALAMLERGLEDHTFTLVFLAYYPTFSSLRDNPRYKRVIERLGVVGPK